MKPLDKVPMWKKGLATDRLRDCILFVAHCGLITDSERNRLITRYGRWHERSKK